ncbi:alpha/beta hydrolase family protein [Cellulomonas timonensis]|uniref:alpha/beta hydrolase family protein n=1 Tax=Cellulomonas timonensis TaxID=1689271 RepID=UPI0008361FD5|nr:acyl-CoA thioester hydrolase/BAAT C-terminal domain-containing protein [Cellulomonas timonensis]
MPYRIAGSTAVGIILLALIGAIMGPQWDPAPISDPLPRESESTVIGGAQARHQYEVRTTQMLVQLDGATVAARLMEPIGAPDGRPGVVFIHGAGTGQSEEAFGAQAQALAESGVVALVPAKRMDTYTTSHRDYEAMAADYEESVRLLRTVHGVDPDQVGVYGESEGAWIAPVIAARDPQVAFVVLVSAPVVPPRQQAAFATDAYLRNTGVPAGVFRAIPRAVGMSLPGGDFEYIDFDVAPFQRQMTQPVLVVYGTADLSMPMVQGAEQIIRDTAIVGNTDITVRYYEDANHGLRVDGKVSATFLRDLSDWVGGLPATAGAAPRIAGADPVQVYLAAPVPTPRWLGDGDVLVGVAAAGASLVVLGPLAMLVARGVERLRGSPARRTMAPGVAARAWTLGVLALLTIGALIWYLLAVARLALGYEQNVWIVQGGWLAVRALGIGAVVAAVLVFDRVRRLRDERAMIARGAVAIGSLGSTLLGSAVLLVVLAYWGVYQLGI